MAGNDYGNEAGYEAGNEAKRSIQFLPYQLLMARKWLAMVQKESLRNEAGYQRKH